MSAEIFVIGSLNMDLVVFTDRHPNLGETILGNSFSTFPGGKGANQAIAAARLGARVKMMGCIGQDDFGTSLIQNLENNHVDTHLVTRAESKKTGTALITVDQFGANSIIVIPGANYQLSVDDLDRVESEFTPKSILVLQLEVPLTVVTHAVRLAKKHGMTVILNPAPAQPLPDELYPQLDYLIPNESELNLLTGKGSTDLSSVRLGVKMLQKKGLRNLLLTRGEIGSLLLTPGQETSFPAFSVQAVDSTAAGDAFIGGFTAALADGQSPIDAIRLGSAAGALAVTRSGAQTSLPTVEEIGMFLQSQT